MSPPLQPAEMLEAGEISEACFVEQVNCCQRQTQSSYVKRHRNQKSLAVKE